MRNCFARSPAGILARYTSVAAIAIASSALPLKSAANEDARDDQVKTEASEDGQTEATVDRLLVAGMHVHFPGFAHVTRWGNGYRLEAEACAGPLA